MYELSITMAEVPLQRDNYEGAMDMSIDSQYLTPSYFLILA